MLLGLKLRALIRDHLSDDSVGETAEFGAGAALMHLGEAWVLLDQRPESRLGPAIAWALRANASALHVVAESGIGVLVRRAGEFSLPIIVWQADGRLLRVGMSEPLGVSNPVKASHEQIRELIAAGGATPVVEHGVLFGETLGLEVCRVVDDEWSGSARLAVGVGAHDREAFAIMHGAIPTVEALTGVVAAVTRSRALGATQHPLGRLAAERFIRWSLEQTPNLVGAEWLVPSAPPVARVNLKDPVPCVASGADVAGCGLVVVCSSGVDLDVIPFAADARLMAGEDHRLVVVMPARDQIRVVLEVNAALLRPAQLIAWGPSSPGTARD